MKTLFVLPECYVDTNLIEFLLGANVNHQHSCSQVVGQLSGTFADRFAVGIIDRDKKELPYLKECQPLAQTEHLTLLKHRVRSQYLITVHPAIDRFLLDCASVLGVDVADYGLPPTLKEFTQETKTVTSNKDPRFKRLFAALLGHPEIRALKASLAYLCENQYRSDDDRLPCIFAGTESDA